MSEVASKAGPGENTSSKSGREEALSNLDLPDDWKRVATDKQRGVLFIKNRGEDHWQSISLTAHGSKETGMIVANYRKAPYDATRVGRDPVDSTSLDDWADAIAWVNDQVRA